MYHSKVYTATTRGLEVYLVEVEVIIDSRGFPGFNIVGLADKSVEESKERVRASIKSSGYKFPDQRITVNLAPAEIHKSGTHFDLAISIGLLLCSAQIKSCPPRTLFVGELSLDGRLRSVNGVLPITDYAKKHGLTSVFLPASSLSEVSLVSDIAIYGFTYLRDVTAHISGVKKVSPAVPVDISKCLDSGLVKESSIDSIIGQEKAKRALTICAAGGHNLAMKGSPGSGKTLLAKALAELLPPLTALECQEVSKIYSVAGILASQENRVITSRPFRAPHHTISITGLLGGGVSLMPGEVSLAHRGVLFIDEFSEMPRFLIEALRQPLEDGYITISRYYGKFTFPSRFIFVACYNPCPCGFYGDPLTKCRCGPYDILSYQRKFSGPVLDRIDMLVDVPSIKAEDLKKAPRPMFIDSQRKIKSARQVQKNRLASENLFSNSEMTLKHLKQWCVLGSEQEHLMSSAMTKYKFSLRTYHRILKVARTIADLEESERIRTDHLSEALQYRVAFTGGIGT